MPPAALRAGRRTHSKNACLCFWGGTAGPPRTEGAEGSALAPEGLAGFPEEEDHSRGSALALSRQAGKSEAERSQIGLG